MSDTNMNEIDPKYAPVQNTTYGFTNGAGSPRENALRYQQVSNEQQNKANNMLGGYKKRRNTIKWNKKGGNANPQTGQKIEVPQFSEVGPPVGGTSATQISQLANQLKLDAVVAGQNDCHGTNSCGQNGGSKHRRRHSKKQQYTRTQRKPYSISSKRVRLSPFKTISTLKKTLKAYKNGRKIGFTQKSSLRSMGLIPRSNGQYKLGNKY